MIKLSHIQLQTRYIFNRVIITSNMIKTILRITANALSILEQVVMSLEGHLCHLQEGQSQYNKTSWSIEFDTGSGGGPGGR